MSRHSATDFFVAVSTAILVLASSLRGQTVNVTTWHNDNLRTGQNLNETTLTPASLGTFGQRCSYEVDGQVYAQPLVVTGATILGTYYPSAVLVVTQADTLYAFSGAPPEGGKQCTLIGSMSLIPSGQYPTDCHYLGAGNGVACENTIGPYVGILSTPVVGPLIPNKLHSQWPLYVVTETQNVPPGNSTPPTVWYHHLHAVGIQSLSEITAPVQIAPPGLSASAASTWSRAHIQRPALLLAPNDYIYIAFSMMDGNHPFPNGAVFGYNPANPHAPSLYFPTTPDNMLVGGGVWQGGAGLAYGPDESGASYIYFNTGNGDWDGVTKWGDSFLKLDPATLTVPSQGYFTPADQSFRNCKNPFTDVDFGSGGVLLTPASSYWPYLAVTGEKEGGIWGIDRLNPGHFNRGACSPGCSRCAPEDQDQSNLNVQTFWLNQGLGPAIHDTPAYWNNNLYLAPAGGLLGQLQICNNYPAGKPFCNRTIIHATDPSGKVVRFDHGATPSVSASSATTNGIVWAVKGQGGPKSTTPGILYAFDATTLAGLYASSGSGSSCPQVDKIAPSIKFAAPTIANGNVYLGTEALDDGVNKGAGTFYIFGLNRDCEKRNPDLNKPGNKK